MLETVNMVKCLGAQTRPGGGPLEVAIEAHRYGESMLEEGINPACVSLLNPLAAA